MNTVSGYITLSPDSTDAIFFAEYEAVEGGEVLTPRLHRPEVERLRRWINDNAAGEDVTAVWMGESFAVREGGVVQTWHPDERDRFLLTGESWPWRPVELLNGESLQDYVVRRQTERAVARDVYSATLQAVWPLLHPAHARKVAQAAEAAATEAVRGLWRNLAGTAGERGNS